MIIDSEFLETLRTFLKAENLLYNYDTVPNKLTANNYNYVLCAVIALDEFDKTLKTLIDTNYSTLENLMNNNKTVLEGKIKTLSDSFESLKGLPVTYAETANHANFATSASTAYIASSALSARNSDYADTARIAGQVSSKIKFITNNYRNEIEYYGLNNVLISSIISSYYANDSISAQIANDALSSIEAYHSILSNTAENALKVNHYLWWFNPDTQLAEIYDGSAEKQISSLLYSISSYMALTSTFSLSSQFDDEGYPINTMVSYFSSSKNYDYPILFSTLQAGGIEEGLKYGVNFHGQINVNPYLGAIKANYFIGTAISATYAVCDTLSNYVNTRVCQNYTLNNYPYPISLSFIDANGNPVDGKNNELLYTAYMRINPFNNIIFTKGIPSETAEPDIDYSIYNGTEDKLIEFVVNGETHKHIYKSHQLYDINLVGLATRALYDLSGYPINLTLITFKDPELNEWKPLITSTSAYNREDTDNPVLYLSIHDILTYSDKILFHPVLGALHLSGQFYNKKYILTLNDLYVGKNTVISGNTYISGTTNIGKSVTIGQSESLGQYNTNSLTTYGQLHIFGDAWLDKTVAIKGSATINSTGSQYSMFIDTNNVTIFSSTNSNHIITINGGTTTINGSSTTINCATTIKGATSISDTLTVDGGITVGTSNTTSTINGTLKGLSRVYSTYFYGIATSAQWADLALKYETDMLYPIGTLVQFGGEKLITIATNEVNAVISDKPAYLMNSKGIGQPIALIGKVKVRIIGKVNKFDYIILSDIPGIGISNGKNKNNNIIGRALENKITELLLLLLCIIKLEL